MSEDDGDGEEKDDGDTIEGEIAEVTAALIVPAAGVGTRSAEQAPTLLAATTATNATDATVQRDPMCPPSMWLPVHTPG